MLLAFLLFTYTACKDDDSKPSGGLTGVWTVDELGTISSFKRYQVSIVRSTIDTNLYIIANFYRLGYETEVYMQLADTVLTIDGQYIGSTFVGGSGVLKEGNKEMKMHYQVDQGNQTNELEATFRK